jgi:hypothetical protein
MSRTHMQLALLAGRKLRNIVRHPWLFVTAFVATLATAVLMGVVYADMGRMTPGIQVRASSLPRCRAAPLVSFSEIALNLQLQRAAAAARQPARTHWRCFRTC